MSASVLTTPSPRPVFKLEVHICNQSRSYYPSFNTEDQVLGFIARREAQDEAWREANAAPAWSGGHTYTELEDYPIPETWSRVWDLLYPSCPHNLSLDLCYGPGHYPPDDPYSF